MPKYRVMLNGKNFLIMQEGQERRFGYYQNIFVESISREKAELDAVELSKNDPELKESILNSREDPPLLYMEEIVELTSFEGIETKVQGRSWYEENKQNA